MVGFAPAFESDPQRIGAVAEVPQTVRHEYYKGYTKDELERQYDIENSVPDFAAYAERYKRETERVQQGLVHVRDVVYGSHALERLDIYPAPAAGSPVQVYLHGGGWRASSKDVRGFPAEAFVQAGATFVAVDYPLAPQASMDEIVAAARRAIVWIWRHIGEYNGDPERIHVSGNSAGGHLAGMLIAPGWHGEPRVPADVVKGMTGVSGAYDLEPHSLTDVRAYLNLDAAKVRRNSPIRNLPARAVPILLAVGADEPAEYLRQARDYAAALAGRGIDATLRVLAGHNHFSIIAELNRSEGELLQEILVQMGLRAARRSGAAAS